MAATSPKYGFVRIFSGALSKLHQLSLQYSSIIENESCFMLIFFNQKALFARALPLAEAFFNVVEADPEFGRVPIRVLNPSARGLPPCLNIFWTKPPSWPRLRGLRLCISACGSAAGLRTPHGWGVWMSPAAIPDYTEKNQLKNIHEYVYMLYE